MKIPGKGISLSFLEADTGETANEGIEDEDTANAIEPELEEILLILSRVEITLDLVSVDLSPRVRAFVQHVEIVDLCEVVFGDILRLEYCHTHNR